MNFGLNAPDDAENSSLNSQQPSLSSIFSIFNSNKISIDDYKYPESVDYRLASSSSHGSLVNPIRNQGSCGCCWGKRI